MANAKLLLEIQDRYEIEQVLRCYCRGVDRGDANLIRSVYHEDGTDDHGGFKGLGREFAEQLVAATRDRWLASQHLLHQTNIEFDGNVAWTETYLTAHHRVDNDAGEIVLETFGGRYVDRFEKREGIWAIAHRTVVYDWSEVRTAPQEYPSDSFAQGQRSSKDLSYVRSKDSL